MRRPSRRGAVVAVASRAFPRSFIVFSLTRDGKFTLRSDSRATQSMALEPLVLVQLSMGILLKSLPLQMVIPSMVQ